VKIVFCSYLRQKCIDLHATKTKITGPFDYMLPAEMLRFCGPHVVAATWPCTFLLTLRVYLWNHHAIYKWLHGHGPCSRSG